MAEDTCKTIQKIRFGPSYFLFQKVSTLIRLETIKF